ncbi:MAG: AMP-binding protein [Acidobacteriota bacterium]
MLLSIYHKLPPSLRSVAASAHGYYLRGLRYSRETERLVRQAIEQEQWTQAEWADWQQQRTADLLRHARLHVPYYRNYWAEQRRNGNQTSWDYLENWPILEKSVLRKTPRAFVADECKDKLFLIQTSGTTGTPLQLWQSKKALIEWYALVEARSRRWYGVTGQDRWAILGGKLVAPVQQRRPPYWVWNAGMRQLYLSSYHISPQSTAAYVAALQDYRVKYLWGYTSSLYSIAQGMLAQKIKAPELKVVITNAEPLHDYQREVMEAAFRCPVRETYGMAEMAVAAGECEHGSLHLWPSVGLVEVLDGERKLAAREIGDLVCTGLINADMPLVRYRVRDRGALAPTGTECACGRSLPMLKALEGRTDDLIYASDGRSFGRLDPILKGTLPIRELQFVQEELDAVQVKYVPADGFSSQTEIELTHRIRQYLGDFTVRMVAVDRIERSANGKFRQVVCLLPADRRPSIHRQVTPR